MKTEDRQPRGGVRRWPAPRFRRRCLVGLLSGLSIVLLVVAGLWAARAQWLPPAARWLDVGETVPRHADYALVLPGDENTRPFVAAALVKAGLADRVLVPKNAIRPEVADGLVPPTHEVIRQVLLQRGVPGERITVLEGDTATTEDDLAVLARFLHHHPDARVTVVTSGYHTRRTRRLVRRLLPDRQTQIFFVSSPVDHFCLDRWWRSEAGFVTITSEYLKLAATLAP